MQPTQQIHGGVRSRAGMKRKSFLTPNQDAYVRGNYNRMTMAEMAHNLGLQHHEVSNFMRYEKLERYIKPKQCKGNAKVLEGFFNVMERENWAI